LACLANTQSGDNLIPSPKQVNPFIINADAAHPKLMQELQGVRVSPPVMMPERLTGKAQPTGTHPHATGGTSLRSEWHRGHSVSRDHDSAVAGRGLCRSLTLSPGRGCLALLANPLAGPFAEKILTAEQTFARLLGRHLFFFILGRNCYIAHVISMGINVAFSKRCDFPTPCLC